MRRYQRGFIVALLGILATTLVKVVGIRPKNDSKDGWIKLTVEDLKREP